MKEEAARGTGGELFLPGGTTGRPRAGATLTLAVADFGAHAPLLAAHLAPAAAPSSAAHEYLPVLFAQPPEEWKVGIIGALRWRTRDDFESVALSAKAGSASPPAQLEDSFQFP